eukprot:scaffold195003_cov39-Attheya_sp.AAC.1
MAGSNNEDESSDDASLSSWESRKRYKTVPKSPPPPSQNQFVCVEMSGSNTMNFFGRQDDDEDLLLPALQAVLEDLAPHILSFLDVPTLVQKKIVCHSWQRRFTETVDQKVPTPPRPFQSGQELRHA